MTISPPRPADDSPSAIRPEDAGQWTAKLRGTAVEALPPERLLPDRHDPTSPLSSRTRPSAVQASPPYAWKRLPTRSGPNPTP